MIVGSSSISSAQKAVRKAVKLARGDDYGEAIPLFEAHLAGLAKGTLADRRLAAAAFSYFGVCLASERRKYADAVQYCEISLRTNPLDPEHRTNLALIYLERDDRARAIETLNSGLRLDKNNRRIHKILDELGRRKQPVFPFLGRQHPVNIWLGKRRNTSPA